MIGLRSGFIEKLYAKIRTSRGFSLQCRYAAERASCTEVQAKFLNVYLTKHKFRVGLKQTLLHCRLDWVKELPFHNFTRECEEHKISIREYMRSGTINGYRGINTLSSVI